MDRTLEEPAPTAPAADQTLERTGSLEFDLCRCRAIVHKARADRVYAQNLYAALCDNVWQELELFEVLRGQTWRCTWRTAGAIVADIRGEGDYMDWYCSGMFRSHPDDDLGTRHPIEAGYVGEGWVTPEILADLHKIGWRLIKVDQNFE